MPESVPWRTYSSKLNLSELVSKSSDGALRFGPSATCKSCLVEDAVIVVDEDFQAFGSQVDSYVDFRRVMFDGNLKLNRIHFKSGVSFIDVHFNGEVDFSNSTFNDHAYFWRCIFVRRANFTSIQTTCERTVPKSERQKGEGNFSFCVFHGAADFSRSEFSGPCYFHRPTFLNKAVFEEAVFKERFVLEGAPHETCIYTPELGKAALSLLDRNVLIPCRDQEDYCHFRPEALRGKPRNSTKKRPGQLAVSAEEERYNEELKGLLGAAGVSDYEECSGRLIQAWSTQSSQPALSRAHVCDFRGVTFEKESPIRHVQLDRCLFENATVMNIDFVGVTWPLEERFVIEIWTPDKPFLNFLKRPQRQPLFKFRVWKRFASLRLELWRPDKPFLNVRRRPKIEPFLWFRTSKRIPLFTRQCVYDEVKLRTRSRITEVRETRRDLSTLYHRLMLRHEQKGDRESARDFYYGEVEMLRLARGRLKAFFSLSHIYKIASGYSKQEGLALTWLLLIILYVAPAFFFWNSHHWDLQFRSRPIDSGIRRSILYSLEASTFLNRPTISDRTDTDELTKVQPEDCTLNPGAPNDTMSLYCGGKLSRRRRLIEALERLFVAIQAALFLIAVKSRFKGPAT